MWKTHLHFTPSLNVINIHARQLPNVYSEIQSHRIILMQSNAIWSPKHSNGSNLWKILIFIFPCYREKLGWIFWILQLQAKARQCTTQLPLLPAPPALGWWLHTGCPRYPPAKHFPHAHPHAQFHFHPQSLPITPDAVQPHIWDDE